MLKGLVKHILVLLFGSVFVLTVGAVHAQAAALLFDPESSEVDVDESFSVDVTIDTGTSQVAGADIYITYDSSIVSLQSVTGGDFFPIVTNIPETDQLYVAGVVANQGEYKTGTGTVATLVFKAVETGETQLKFTCDLTQTETSKINQNDINASNIIDCSKLGVHDVTVSDGTGTSAATKPTSLPESGVYETMVLYSSLGGLLVVVGFGLRLLIRVV